MSQQQRNAPHTCDSMSLTADHITYRINRLQTEYTNARLWAIQRQNPLNEAEFMSASLLALYKYYHDTLDCEYNAAVERRIGAHGCV